MERREKCILSIPKEVAWMISLLLMSLSLQRGLGPELMPERLSASMDGKKVIVEYLPSAPNMVLSSPLLLVQFYGAEKIEPHSYPLKKKGSKYGCSFPLDPEAVMLAMKVEDGNWVDDAEGVGFIFLVEEEPGKPRKDAYHQLGVYLRSATRRSENIPEALPLSFYEKESALYPNNPLVLLSRWSASKDPQRQVVQKQLEEMASTAREKGSPDDLLFAYEIYQHLGYAFEIEARNVAEEFIRRYPSHPRAEKLQWDVYLKAQYIKPEEAIEALQPFLHSRNPEIALEAKKQLFHKAMEKKEYSTALRLFEEYRKAGFSRAGIYDISQGMRAAGFAGKLDTVEAILKEAEAWLNSDYALRLYFWMTPEERRAQIDNSRSTLYKARVEAFLESASPQRTLKILQDSSGYLVDATEVVKAYLTLSEQFEKQGKLQMAWEMALQAFEQDPTYEAVVERLKVLYVQREGSEKGFQSFLAGERKKWREKKGTPAPNFRLLDLDGKEVTLQDARGKIVVMNFWGVWCGPCISEIPALNALVDKYGSRESILFWAFSPDSPKNIRNFLTRSSFRYRQFPSAQKVAEILQVRSWPTHIIIDTKGNIRFRRNGPLDPEHNFIEETLQYLLQE